MKQLVLYVSLILNFNIFAGQFSEIDIIVRETIIEAYTITGFETELAPQWNDIWGLNFAENNPEECLLTVSGMAKKPTYNRDFKFWVCVNRDENGSLWAYLIKDELQL